MDRSLLLASTLPRSWGAVAVDTTFAEAIDANSVAAAASLFDNIAAVRLGS